MVSHHEKRRIPAHSNKDSGEQSQSGDRCSKRAGVTQANGRAHRRKLDAQACSHKQHTLGQEQQETQASNQIRTTLSRAIADYLSAHEGGNHSRKTLEWHETALGFLQEYLEQEQGIALVRDIDAPDISGWFSHLRKTPGARGKLRSERTIQTYARSVRAFFHWLVRQGVITDNPFDGVVFPQGGKSLIQTITDEEFGRLLLACVPPMKRDVWLNAQPRATAPFCGCSTIRGFVCRN